MEAMEAMAPTANENQLLTPVGNGLDQFCKMLPVMHQLQWPTSGWRYFL